jgi:hypothetical protein
MDEQGRVVERLAWTLPLLNHTDHHPGFADSTNQLVQGLIMGLKEIAPFKQVLGRIAAQGQLRENGQGAACLPGLPETVKQQAKVAREITDERVGLNEGNFHLAGKKYMETEGIAV